MSAPRKPQSRGWRVGALLSAALAANGTSAQPLKATIEVHHPAEPVTGAPGVVIREDTVPPLSQGLVTRPISTSIYEFPVAAVK